MNNNSVVILGTEGISTNILYHYLSKDLNIAGVIIEEPESSKKFLSRRIRRLGWWNVFGQLLFMVMVVPLLHIYYASRKRQIIDANHLDDSLIPEYIVSKVSSVNSTNARKLLRSLAPYAVIVSGTRIISKKTLKSTDAVFLNMHAGITPEYRGVHGGYWALYCKDEKNCGVTVHVVDEGVDTGDVVDQEAINPDPGDSYATYPLLQMAAGLPLLRNVVHDVFNKKLVLVARPDSASRQWVHPTLWQYLYGLLKGVR